MKSWRFQLTGICLFIGCIICSEMAFSMGAGKNYTDPIAPIILGVTTILLFAVLGRFAARKLDQPSVLGELVMGIILGNLLYFCGVDLIVILREGSSVFDIVGYVMSGHTLHQAVTLTLGNTSTAEEIFRVLQSPDGLSLVKVSHVVDIFSRYGVIFLLFLVGLESSVDDLHQTGRNAIKVAIIGVVLPMALGYLILSLFGSDHSVKSNLFTAAAMAATSIGITASVLQDLHKTRSKEAHVILSAAMIDDILGLILLAIVTSVIATGSVEIRFVIRIFALATLFISSALVMGPSILNLLVNLLKQMDVLEAKLFISFLFVMALAWFATLLGLATIVGAFAAGVILHDGYFRHWGDTNKHQFTIKDLVSPLEAILAPLFFILIGIQVKLETFMDGRVIALSSGLIVAASVGKLLAGLGADKSLNRLAIGIGMLPRGEVGLVFASIGKSLGVIPDTLFASIIMMVMVTTLIAPPLLKWRMQERVDS